MNSYLKDSLEHGAFLTVKNGDRANTMTIGWGMEGISWGRKAFMVLVREQRHTYELLRDAAYFTVSIPHSGDLKEALHYFGTHTGRTEDKYASGLISLKKANAADGYLVEGCAAHFEAKILWRHALSPEEFSDSTIKETVYRGNDYHTLYIGEIISYSEG
jgi:flavin reductase (DIM6/NTAB) family NADH-FMN oxidoreductase RutF